MLNMGLMKTNSVYPSHLGSRCFQKLRLQKATDVSITSQVFILMFYHIPADINLTNQVILYGGSYMSAHVLLNLLNELR